MQPTSPPHVNTSPRPLVLIRQPQSTSSGPALPASDTVDTLQVLGNRKRKQTNFDPASQSAKKQISTEPESVPFAGSTSEPSGPPDSASLTGLHQDHCFMHPKQWAAMIIRNSANFSLRQVGEKMTMLGSAMGGAAMAAEDRDGLLSEILAAHASSTYLQMGQLVLGLAPPQLPA